jgi:hypothetical protein
MPLHCIVPTGAVDVDDGVADEDSDDAVMFLLFVE